MRQEVGIVDVYQRAWASLLKRIEAKTSWGRNELKNEMLGALVDADPNEEAMADEETPEETDARLARVNAAIRLRRPYG